MKLEQRAFHTRSKQRILAILVSFVLAATLMSAPLAAMTGVAENSKPGDTEFTFGDFVGSNSFFDENQSCYDILGNVREYHPWGLTEWTAGVNQDSNGRTSNSITGMNPRATFINSWGAFDNYYRTMHEKGIEVTLVMHGKAKSIYGRPDYQDPDGTKSAVPASYLGHAQSMFQHAARYGSNKNIDPALVRVAAGTRKEIGLGYVRYYENYNEPINNGFTGAQYAAMLSADYDGHMGTMGPDAGVKTADPNAKVVFGGSYVGWFSATANGRFTFTFLADMMAWFDTNRTLEQWKAAHGGSAEGYVKYPFDVVSAHGYSWDGFGNGISAEASHYYQMFKTFVDNCKTIFPDKEYYFSEFGWDTSPSSSIRASTPGLTTMETQGRWLVRKYLLAAAAGIDRARQFMMPNTSNNPNDPDWFGTCGLINGIQGSVDFKPSWYYIGTMRHVLKDAALHDIEILADGGWAASGAETGGPWALKFNSAKNSDRIFALWLPTSLGDQNGANAQDYTITVPAGYRYATLITMKDKVKWGVRTDISNRIKNNSLTVSISEKPLFVILGESAYNSPAINDFIDPRKFTTWTLTSGSGDPRLLFDENRTDISKDPTPGMQKAWTPGGMHRYAVIDLGMKYSLSNMYVWDRDGALAAGKVLAVYAYTGGGQPLLPANTMTGSEVRTMLSGNGWNRIAWYDFASWESWVEKIVKVETRYLILGFEDGPSAFYANPWPRDWLPVPEMILKGAPASSVSAL